jgi:hypothetical protein
MDPLTLGAVSAGAETISSLAERIFASGDRKKIERMIAFLRSKLGAGGISDVRQRQMFADIDRSMVPEQNRLLSRVNKRLGLDSGAAWGEYMRIMEPERARRRLDVSQLSERLRSMQDRQLYSGMTGLTGAAYG